MCIQMIRLIFYHTGVNTAYKKDAFEFFTLLFSSSLGLEVQWFEYLNIYIYMRTSFLSFPSLL